MARGLNIISAPVSVATIRPACHFARPRLIKRSSVDSAINETSSSTRLVSAAASSPSRSSIEMTKAIPPRHNLKSVARLRVPESNFDWVKARRHDRWLWPAVAGSLHQPRNIGWRAFSSSFCSAVITSRSEYGLPTKPTGAHSAARSFVNTSRFPNTKSDGMPIFAEACPLSRRRSTLYPSFKRSSLNHCEHLELSPTSKTSSPSEWQLSPRLKTS